MTESIAAHVELRLRTTNAVWLGDIEAQGREHLRVRLRAHDLGVIPTWPQGTIVDCALQGEEGRYHIGSTVLEQRGELLWLDIARHGLLMDRRESTRIAGTFMVWFRWEALEFNVPCVDISPGGISLAAPMAPMRGDELHIKLLLPGVSDTMELRGRVMSVRDMPHATDLSCLGVKFAALLPEQGIRIARYCYS